MDRFGIVLHWLRLGPTGAAICLYRVGDASGEPRDFSPQDIAQLDALAPYLARILSLDAAFKMRASSYEFFSRRTIELAEQHGLTSTEYRVLHQMVSGADNASIAQNMGVSVATVKTHITSLMAKLGARNRVEIAIWAYETRRAGLK